MTRIGSATCVDSTPRGTGDFYSALAACAAANLRLPTVSETYLAAQKNLLPASFSWTDNLYREGSIAGFAYFGGTNSFASTPLASSLSFSCAATPADA
jgi:hypothetical protein